MTTVELEDNDLTYIVKHIKSPIQNAIFRIMTWYSSVSITKIKNTREARH